MEYQPPHCDVPAQCHNSAKAKYCRRNHVGRAVGSAFVRCCWFLHSFEAANYDLRRTEPVSIHPMMAPAQLKIQSFGNTCGAS